MLVAGTKQSRRPAVTALSACLLCFVPDITACSEVVKKAGRPDTDWAALTAQSAYSARLPCRPNWFVPATTACFSACAAFL